MHTPRSATPFREISEREILEPRSTLYGFATIRQESRLHLQNGLLIQDYRFSFLYPPIQPQQHLLHLLLLLPPIANISIIYVPCYQPLIISLTSIISIYLVLFGYLIPLNTEAVLKRKKEEYLFVRLGCRLDFYSHFWLLRINQSIIPSFHI